MISRASRGPVEAAQRQLLTTRDDRASADLMEAEAKRSNGHSFPVELALSPIQSADQSWQFAAFVRDVSTKREHDRRILASLKEKEVLLKEVHHRVKNNLQVISSLLSLQAQHTRDVSARRLFADSQSRVQSIALVHEALYRSKDLARIRLDEYVHNLVERLFHAHSGPGDQIRASLDLSGVELSVGRAIPCGLIINELVTNALKYAFPDGRLGTVEVALRHVDAKIELVVGDDGVGLPPEVDPRGTASLGLDLVLTFAEQLEAEVDVQRQYGTRFCFRFPGEP
jgi:two-component sensor histidine kinase